MVNKPQRKHWLRLVAVRDETGAILVIDRHSTYVSQGRYATLHRGLIQSGRLTCVGSNLLFCPDASRESVRKETKIIGRIVQVQSEE